MGALLARGQQLAERARRRKLEEIANAMRGMGIVAEIAGTEVIGRGRTLTNRWLADPLLRFAGRLG